MKHSNLPILALFFLLILTSCSKEENKFYLVENSEVLYIDDDKSIYSKGDIFWLNMIIPETQMDQITNSEIDIFQLTGAEETFVGLSIYDNNDSEINTVVLNPDLFQVELGSFVIQDNLKILGRAVYQNGSYRMRIGIPLNTSGEFFLANSDIAGGTQSLAFNTNGNNNIQFNTRIRSSNGEGRFNFVVE